MPKKVTHVEAYKKLACDILYYAIDDLNRCRKKVASKVTVTPHYVLPRLKIDECVSFFNSTWCKDLCALADIDWDVMMEKLALPIGNYDIVCDEDIPLDGNEDYGIIE